jgi:hypothetical protein
MSAIKAFTLGQFRTSDEMLAAARQIRSAGYTDVDGYLPYPVEGMEEALGIKKSRIPKLVLGGAMTGALSGYLMQWWMNSVDWAINVGGRPPHSPPSFVPVTFELGILFGSLTAFMGLWALCKLPRLHHPVFESADFCSASIDRFWLSVATPVSATEDRQKITAQLSSLGAEVVTTVEGEDE